MAKKAKIFLLEILKNNNFRGLPQRPGIYIFKDANKSPVYIGKSVNLRQRVKSYFSSNLGPKTKNMINSARFLSYIEVNSEIESLVLEAKLVKLLKPKYNFALKDDKNPLYIRITKDKYPRIITARRVSESEDNLAFFGPFPSSGAVRSVLKTLRKLFPFSDHKLGKKSCLLSQIGLCSPCPNYIENTVEKGKDRTNLSKEYKKNVSRVYAVLSGEFKRVRSWLYREMRKYSDNLEFEYARKLREKINYLDYITQVQTPSAYFLENPNMIHDLRNAELSSLNKIIKDHTNLDIKLKRIECFDVSHISGYFSTASMVTFINATAEKSYYRHFKIRQKKTESDVFSMEEIAKRRIKYLGKWGKPDLIIVDGGVSQTKVFKRIFESEGIYVCGIAKRFETLILPVGLIFKEIRLSGPALYLIQRIRDEAHRFARRYHHKLFSLSLS